MVSGFIRRLLPLVFSGSIVGCSVMSGPIYEGRLKSYSVQKGDTLFDIAEQSNIHVDLLADINELENPERLSIGQVIQIPAEASIPLRKVIRSASSQPGHSFQAPLSPAPESIERLNLSTSAAAGALGKLLWPVAGGEPGSRFGTREGNFHEGLDIRARTGTPILAAHKGEVVFSGNEWSGYGNMIVIKGDGVYTVYAHNHENYVDTGDIVEQGEEIGAVGRTGRASGCHLHFEVRVDDPRGHKVAVNPALFLKGSGARPQAPAVAPREEVITTAVNRPLVLRPPNIARDGERY